MPGKSKSCVFFPLSFYIDKLFHFRGDHFSWLENQFFAFRIYFFDSPFVDLTFEGDCEGIGDACKSIQYERSDMMYRLRYKAFVLNIGFSTY